jgi:hypothetical protein
VYAQIYSFCKKILTLQEDPHRAEACQIYLGLLHCWWGMHHDRYRLDSEPAQALTPEIIARGTFFRRGCCTRYDARWQSSADQGTPPTSATLLSGR